MKKTLQECKEIVAKENSYESWSDLIEYYNDNIGCIEQLTDLANKMYYEQSEWISVEDYLPEHRIFYCLVFNGDAPLYNQHVFQAVFYTESNKFTTAMSKTYLGSITHWQPLPNPPQK